MAKPVPNLRTSPKGVDRWWWLAAGRPPLTSVLRISWLYLMMWVVFLCGCAA